jgi:hypothetical protein
MTFLAAKGLEQKRRSTTARNTTHINDLCLRRVYHETREKEDA